ncbi:hypothetical protein [Streptomyces chartreusis]
MHRRTLDSYARSSAAGGVSIAHQHQANFRRIEALSAILGKAVDGQSLGCPGWAQAVKRLESGASDGVVVYRLGQLIQDPDAGRLLADLARAGFAVYDSDAEIDLVIERNRDDDDDAVKDAEDYAPAHSTPVRRGDARRGRPPVNTYLCTGRESPVRCGNCGHHLDINTNARGKTYSDGVLKHHYRCLKTTGGCGKTIADWRVLDEIIEDIMLRWLSDPSVLEILREVQETRNMERQPLLKEIADRERRKAHWGALFNDGEITESELTHNLRELNAAIKAAQSKLGEIESVPLSTIDAEAIAQILEEWQNADSETKRADLHRAWEGFHVLVDPGSSTDDKDAVRRRVHRPRRIAEPVRPIGD